MDMADSAGQDTSQTPTILYKPLDSSKSIRLLKVLPEKDDEIIRCKLIHVNLADSKRPGYIALSYEWRIPRDEIDSEHDGDTNEQVTIECDGVGTNIGRNLWDFLAQFRRVDAMVESYLWVDAICINQSDDDERSQQVKLMGDVYSKAESVIAWLGEVANEEAFLFDEERIGLNHPQWRLLRRPYWSRVWIVQEVCLARSLAIWYGPCRYNPTGWQLDKGGITYYPGSEVLKKRWKLHIPIGERDWTGDLRLGELVVDFAGSECTELLDGVYGFIGIASQASGSPPNIIVDYNREPVEVLVDVFKDHYASFRKPYTVWDECALVGLIMTRLDVSHEIMKGYILKSFPGLEAYEDLITEESLPVLASRLFITGFLDYDPDDFDGNGDRWNRFSWQDNNPFDEKLKACEYFRKPRSWSSSSSLA